MIRSQAAIRQVRAVFAIAFLLLVNVFHARAQEQPTVPDAVMKAIPKGYELLNSASGDLNLDPYPDLLLVLRQANEAETSDAALHPGKRPLLIFTGGPGHTYRLAARNDNAVYCVDCGGMMGDPFTDIVIKHGYFSIEHYGGSAWRWTRIITFKYAPAEENWLLYKDGNESFHASEPDKITTKTYTVKNFGRVPFARFDIYKDLR
jgi:hypothetical protein